MGEARWSAQDDHDRGQGQHLGADDREEGEEFGVHGGIEVKEGDAGIVGPLCAWTGKIIKRV